jgi:hypothetical protein
MLRNLCVYCVPSLTLIPSSNNMDARFANDLVQILNGTAVLGERLQRGEGLIAFSSIAPALDLNLTITMAYNRNAFHSPSG